MFVNCGFPSQIFAIVVCLGSKFLSSYERLAVNDGDATLLLPVRLYWLVDTGSSASNGHLPLPTI